MQRPVIFICYSNKDKEFVRSLVSRLNADGIETWFDEVEIKIGESIHQKVNDGLNKSDFFVIILSRSSVESRWVQNELSSASNIEKYSGKGVFILPLLLEECDVPPLLLDRRYANFKEDAESAYQELLDSIREHFKMKHPEVKLPPAAISEIDEHFINVLGNDTTRFSEISPRQFESLVASILQRMGFTTRFTDISKDGGYDLIAAPNSSTELARQKIIVQCKRYLRPIGAQEVRSLLGSMLLAGADKAVFVTTATFTRAAQEVADGQPIDLVDGETLSKWIRDLPNLDNH